MAELIKPKEVQIKDLDGVEKTYVISRLPATAGREILAKYPVSNLPRLGEYKASEDAMHLLLSYVAIVLDSGQVRLSTPALINNHVNDAEALLRLEYAMLEYNTSFFGKGGPSGFLEGLVRKYLPRIMSMLTDFSPPSSAPDSPPGQSSKPR